MRLKACVTLLVAANVVDPVGSALLTDPSFDHCPEVVTVVKVEAASFSGLEADLPHSHLIVLEQQAGPDVAVAVPGLGQFIGEIPEAIPAFLDYFHHADKASCRGGHHGLASRRAVTFRARTSSAPLKMERTRASTKNRETGTPISPSSGTSRSRR